MQNNLIAVLMLLMVSLSGNQLNAQSNWARFRGPNGSGVVADANLPTQWKQPTWQATLAGTGNSSPVAWQDRIFVTSCDSDSAKVSPKVSLECLSLKDGQRLWLKSFESNPYPLHRFNSYAASTPAVDQDNVYLLVADTGNTTRPTSWEEPVDRGQPPDGQRCLDYRLGNASRLLRRSERLEESKR